MSNTVRVLVVDDCADNAATLARLIELWGYEVRVAYDGAGALDVARSYRPFVVFLDLGLPDLSGYEVAGRLQVLFRCQPVLLVAITGYGQEEDCRRGQEAGFAHHLLKPVSPAFIEGLLAEHRRHSTAA
jgi:CheY-like chemotaxis protein